MMSDFTSFIYSYLCMHLFADHTFYILIMGPVDVIQLDSF